MRTEVKIHINKLLIVVSMLLLFYGCEKQDGKNAPVVRTLEVKDITDKTALAINEITGEGGSMVTARGVCWSKNQSPTINDNKTFDGAGMGLFASVITGLEPNTTYYMRAYGTNSMGTSYGNEITFTTPTGQIPDGTTGTVTYDGYTYKTVYIGGREWMAENLRTNKYNDGTSIPTGHSLEQWIYLTTGAYAVYPHSQIDGLNSDAEVLQAYGALYNWYAVETGKLCPTGWSVPTFMDFSELIQYIDPNIDPSYLHPNSGYISSSIAGGRLKSSRTSPSAHPRWDTPNTGATDSYGFSALPSSSRYAGQFISIPGKWATWWSSSEFILTAPPYGAWVLDMRFDLSIATMTGIEKLHGLSVRCVRDN